MRVLALFYAIAALSLTAQALPAPLPIPTPAAPGLVGVRSVPTAAAFYLEKKDAVAELSPRTLDTIIEEDENPPPRKRILEIFERRKMALVERPVDTIYEEDEGPKRALVGGPSKPTTLETIVERRKMSPVERGPSTLSTIPEEEERRRAMYWAIKA
jgi:hypothetical protein